MRNMEAPGSYIGFSKFDSTKQVQDAYQISPTWSDAKLRDEFDTLQIMDSAYVPKEAGDTGDLLEPITSYYSEYGNQGKVQVEHLKDCLLEVHSIRLKFSKLSSYDNVWNFEDLTESDPWGNQICSEIPQLSDYFITKNGSNLINMIIRVLEHAISVEKIVEVSTI